MAPAGGSGAAAVGSGEAETGAAAGSQAAGFTAEAAGCAGSREAGAVPVPEVLGWDEAVLVISWVPAEASARQAAERFGRDLARLHAAGAGTFGAPWPGSIAGLPLGNDAGDSWPEWYGTQRLLPYARLARDAGSLTSADVGLIETVADRARDLAGPAEPPSRIHGDCWSGNVLWSGGRGWLIDPAAHGGHRETDLAMLALFGAPFLARIVACYGRSRRWPPGGGSGCRCTSCTRCWCTCACSARAYRASALDAARSALSRMP